MCLRVFLIIFLFLLALPSCLYACACSKESPGVCPGLQKDDNVFLGTVTAIEDLPADPAAAPGTTPIWRFRFHINERFAGPPDPDIDVFSGGDDGDCGYQFKLGEQYVVYTQQETEGRLFSTICNGTRPSSDARALLPQLRAMKNGEHVASVFGLLHRSDPPLLAPSDDPDDPLPHIKLKLRSHDDRFATSTGPDGVYTFYDVHAGEYQYTADLPARFEFSQKSLKGGLPPFRIPNGACFEYNVAALPTGKIRGSVRGPDGKPLAIASVELYRADRYDDTRPGLWGFQGRTGDFEFDHIGPGEYILVFNRSNRMDPNSPFPRAFYPGTPDANDARPIKLKDGQQLSKIDIHLGVGFPTRRLRVQLKWKEGRPPGEVTVMAKAEQGENPAAQKIGDATYEFNLLRSAHYTISAWEDLDPQRHLPHSAAACPAPGRLDAPSVSIDAADANEEITLVFAAPGCAQPETAPDPQ